MSFRPRVCGKLSNRPVLLLDQFRLKLEEADLGVPSGRPDLLEQHGVSRSDTPYPDPRHIFMAIGLCRPNCLRAL